MEDYKLVSEQAYREAKMADHMAFVTSKVVNDKKIIISIVDHLSKAFILSIKSYMLFLKYKHKIESLPKDDKELLTIFFETYAQELKIEKSLLDVIQRLYNAVNAYETRGILLTRADKYVFVSPEYELIDFNLESIKNWLRDGVKFVSMIKEMVTNEY